MPSSKCARASSTNCEVYLYTPSTLCVDGYSISPAYKPYIKNYTLTVPFSTSSVTISASVNNASEASLSGTGAKDLKVGSNTFTVTCTAANGAPSSSSYSLTITRSPASTVSTLSSLSVDGYSLTPAFSASVKQYSLIVPFNITSANISASPADTKATVTGTGLHDLSYGENNISVTCTAESGAQTQYSINIYREVSYTDIKRISGSNRFETSISAAEEFKSVKGIDKFTAVIIASGDNFPDALSSSALSSACEAPVILTNRNYDESAIEYVRQNLIDGGKVYLTGGTSILSSNWEQQLGGSYNVLRLRGPNRYITNLAVLEEFARYSGSEGFSEGLMVCSGSTFPDSLSAAATGIPVMLTNGRLSEDQKTLIASNGITKFYICGGDGAVPSSVESALKEYGEVVRLGGADRYETSSIIAQYFASDSATAAISSGENFPDALSAVPLCVETGSPLFLVNSSNTKYASSYFDSGEHSDLYIFGGTGVISDSIVFNVLC